MFGKERICAVIGIISEATYIDEETKCDPPEDTDEDIHWPVGEGRRERDQPQQGQEDGDGRNDLGVDVATKSPRVRIGLVQELAIDTCHDGSEGELRSSENHTDDAIYSHVAVDALGCVVG